MKKFLCKLFGHKYILKRNICPGIRELACTRCKKEFGMNDAAQAVLPLDFELKELHDDILKMK